jgi:hypothetical protein
MARYCTRENEPFGKWNGVPIYLTTIITVVMVVGLVLSAVLQAMRSPLLEDLMFILPYGRMNWVAAVTYPFIDFLSFFTPFAIFFFYRMALGVETHMGRSALGWLLALLVAVPILLAVVMWSGLGIGGMLRGNYLIMVGLVIAFATLYPSAEFWGWVPFKWVAFACLLAGSLMDLAAHNWVSLVSLWGCAGVAFLFIRHRMEQEMDDAEPVLARVRGWFRRKPKLRVVPKPTVSSRPVAARKVEDAADGEIDALLDKIAKSGLGSLSNSEKAKLERARQELLKKEQL